MRDFDGDRQAQPYRGYVEKAKEAARRLCKLRTLLVFKLDLPQTSHAGALARFTSTGFYTAMYLRSSLQAVALETGNWLACIPLWLVLEWTQQKDTPAGRQRLPYVRFESRVATAELQAQAREISGYLVGNQARMRQLQAASAEVLKVEAAAPDPGYLIEFGPEAAEVPVVTEPEVIDVEPEPEEPLPEAPVAEQDPASVTEEEWKARIYAIASGKGFPWSPPVLRAKVAACDSPDSYAALVKEMRALVPERLAV
jgi:hypothetical protein